MDDQQLLRYSRHILLDELGIEGQRRLMAAHALVIGAGGLGSPVALYLGTAGVGRITIVDDDVVELTNLQRQIAHDLSRLGVPKAESAQRSIHAINPDVRVNALVQRADAALGTPSRDRSWAICRCRLVSSTTSWSTMVMRPTPAVPRYSATGEPSPPAPITSAWLSSSRCWPATLMSSSSRCRE